MKNEALTPLGFLIGRWSVEMVHTALPHPLRWEDSFAWLEESFIIWHWQGRNEVPKSTSIIGRNENKSGDLYTMLYYDARGVSRRLEMSFEAGIWKFWRLDPEFSQRFEGEVSEDRNFITGKGEASNDNGKTWELDYTITYARHDSDV